MRFLDWCLIIWIDVHFQPQLKYILFALLTPTRLGLNIDNFPCLCCFYCNVLDTLTYGHHWHLNRTCTSPFIYAVTNSCTCVVFGFDTLDLHTEQVFLIWTRWYHYHTIFCAVFSEPLINRFFLSIWYYCPISRSKDLMYSIRINSFNHFLLHRWSNQMLVKDPPQLFWLLQSSISWKSSDIHRL